MVKGYFFLPAQHISCIRPFKLLTALKKSY